MYNYSNKKIVILGAGLTGLSCINYFISLNIFPKLMDSNIINNILIPKGIEYCFGYFNKDWLLNSDLIVISPGISSYNPLIIKAKKNGIEIINDIEIFCRINKKPIIAITGTNGKSTVVSLLFNIFRSYNINVSLGGNIGIPVLNLLNNNSDLYILEISSFQLEYIYSLKSVCSCILNITYDHMDRYLYIQDYFFFKFKIFNYSKNCILNINDKKILFKNILDRKVITFGYYIGDYYINEINNNLYLSKYNYNYINVKYVYLKGIFNYLNMLVVICISEIFKISEEIILNNLINFKGLPYRFCVIKKKNGILIINDSKSTNIDSTLSSLNSLSYIKSNIWLLMGGDNKNVDFKKFLKPNLLFYKNLFICCYGKSKDIIFNLIPNISFKFNFLCDVVKFISINVKYNDVILFSPGCSSLDQFDNYKERGLEFIKLINKYF